MDAIAAKEFLISKVVQEADLSHVPLSEIERKMLYFTEVHPSLPDILQVNAAFERDYDADEYEEKIASLLKNARARDTQVSPAHEQWNSALAALKHEDHYILVMAGLAFRNNAKNEHRQRDFLIYVGVGIAFVLVLFLASLWRSGR